MFRQAPQLMARATTVAMRCRRQFSTDVPVEASADSTFVEAWRKLIPNIEPPKTPSSFMTPRPSTPASIPTKLTVNFVLPYSSQLSNKEERLLGLLRVPRVILLFGEKYDYELSTKRDKCERLVRLYKECKTDRLSNCDFYLELRPEGCPDFNKEEFLETLRVSNLKGMSFGTSSSSRGDYDWFETAVISFFKLFGENYDYELLKKRKECERLVGLYKECETNKLSDCDYHLERRPEGCSDFNKEEFLQTLRAPNLKSNGTSFGTSSSSREDYDWFETAVISFFKLFGENYDYELLKKRKECERLVGLYKECKTNKLSNCDLYLEQRPEGCPDFNKGAFAVEFLQTLQAPNPKSNGTSFGTSSSSREDYDWFETAVISFFKLFGENYDYELLKKRKECERLVGLYKECKTNKLSNCDLYLEQGPEGCPDFNKDEEQLGDQSR